MNKNRKIRIIDPHIAAKAMRDAEKGKMGELPATAFEIPAYEIPPLAGYEEKPGFPKCCPYHTRLFELGEKRYNEFPDCCPRHQRLHAAAWFRKEDYAYSPLKLVKAIEFTRHCIYVSINTENWYKEITDYIEETINSYGQLPLGYGPPVGLEMYTYNLQRWLETAEDIPAEKKNKLLEYLLNDKRENEPVEQIDMNLLIDTYQRWLKVFPFQLSFFSSLKPYFQKRLPLLKGPGVTNIYSGLTGYKLVTRDELIGFLVSVTLSIIKEINTMQLFQLGLLNEPDKIKLELIVAKHQLSMEELDKTNWRERKEYIKLLKKWFRAEKEFVTQIIPFLKKANEPTFIQNMLDGMHLLYKNDINEPCIRSVRENGADKESGFRYFFRNFLTGRYPDAVVTAEEEKGNGYIDLKITDKKLGEIIIEFKGWWNRDKKDITRQLSEYLTEFEDTGYIFIINDKQKDILGDYKTLITADRSHYVDKSLIEYQVPGTNMIYLRTIHQHGLSRKQVYHFLFNAWP